VRAFLKQHIRQDRRAVAMLEMLLWRRLGEGDRLKTQHLMAALTQDGALVPTEDAWTTDAVDHLASQRAIVLQSDAGGFTVHLLSEAFPALRRPPQGQRLKTSRFAYLSFDGAAPTIRSPLSDRYLELHDPLLAAVFSLFINPTSLDAPIAGKSSHPEAMALGLALFDAGLLLACDAQGLTEDDREPARRMWDFHDLLFHSRSRTGRTDSPLGGTYAFKGQIPPPAPIADWPPDLAWTRLSVGEPRAEATSLTELLRLRRSIRAFSGAGLSLVDLSAFLEQSVRAKVVMNRGERSLRRPYPNGGALYEQRFFVVADQVPDLERGLYAYDDIDHRLGLLAPPTAELDRVLDDAMRAMGAKTRPPVLVVITSRFGRVSWKYAGISYALQLKHVGVILQTMYLAATALGLGGCAIGVGNTDRFGRLANLDYLEEGSIGEFALGVPAPPEHG